MKNHNITFTTVLLALGFSALSPIAQAVSPAPDGGYPGANTAEGQNALASLDTSAGTYNTADQNTAVGAGALLSNTTGTFNTANGAFALFGNTEGGENTANGASALENNTTGSANTAVGAAALV